MQRKPGHIQQAAVNTDNTFYEAAAGIASVGPDGRFLEVNDGLVRMVGFSREELLQQTFSALTHPDDRAEEPALFDRLMRGEIPDYVLDKRYCRKDGAVIGVRVSVSLLRGSGNTSRSGIAVIQEEDPVRGKPYSEAAVNEADAARNAALHTLNTIGEAAAMTNLNGWVQDATPAFCHLCDTPLEKLRNTDIRHIIEGLLDDPAEVDVEDKIVDTVQCSADETHFDEPLPIPLNDGTVRWVIPHFSNVYGKDEQRIGRLLVLRNVSRLKQAQMASAENERKYRELVEYANTSILRVALDFSITFVNEYAVNFFGFPRRALEGTNLLEILVPKGAPGQTDQHAFMLQVADAPEITNSFDLLNECRNGRRVWVHWTVRAIRDHQGAVRELLLVGTDVTKRKRAEIEAAHYRMRSRKLADQLIETENNERIQIASYLHDNIIQLLSLAHIRLGGVTAAVKENSTPENAERLTGIRDLLSEAVQECRSMMDQLVPALLSELGLGAALSHLAEKHRKLDHTDIHVEDRLDGLQIPSTTSTILFRSARELLMNALKYAGPCRITISLWAEGGQVHLRVADSGSGFDIQTLESDVYDESGGFGLFDIRERLEGLGGDFKVFSEKGQGTTASVGVPLVSCEG